jgi:hypothetical protein
MRLGLGKVFHKITDIVGRLKCRNGDHLWLYDVLRQNGKMIPGSKFRKCWRCGIVETEKDHPRAFEGK